MNQLITVPFHGNQLLATVVAGKPHIAVRPISDALGLDWSSQRKRIYRHPVLAATVVKTSMVAEDGKSREMTLLPVEMLNGWLFGVTVSQVKQIDIRGRVVQYQRECFDVLANHFGLRPPDATTLEAIAAEAKQRQALELEVTTLRAQRDALQGLVREQFLEQHPEYREVLRYHAITGLNYKEKALLMGWKTADTWLAALKKLAALGLIDWQPSDRHVKSGRAAIAKTQALLAGKADTRRKTTPPSPGQQRHLKKMRAAKAGAAAARQDIRAARDGGKAEQPAQGNAPAADADADKLH